jgi:(p)ppGpp synthase/HD superfamily hydrolase
MPTLTNTPAIVELAARIAMEMHSGQADKYGAPYILHVLRVGLAGATWEEQAAGFLHDTLEDTAMTADGLRERGIPDSIVDIVDHLTRREGESYEAFVDRATRHPVARRVKLHDLEDNMDLRRCTDIAARDTDRLARYVRAWRKITEMDRTEAGGES